MSTNFIASFSGSKTASSAVLVRLALGVFLITLAGLLRLRFLLLVDDLGVREIRSVKDTSVIGSSYKRTRSQSTPAKKGCDLIAS